MDNNNERASDNLVHHIEAKILSNNLKDGDTLPSERELMTQYDVSRPVVREAIVKLAGKGLILTKPRYRPVVRKPSIDSALDSISGMIEHLLNEPNGIKNLFNTRVMLEAMLVREAALLADKDDIKALRKALEANFKAIDNSKEFYTTDVLFHSILYSITKNPIFSSIHKVYVNWLANHWKKMAAIPKRNEVNYKYHVRIFEAILNRDPDEAEKALREHLASGWTDIEGTFK